MVTLNPVLYLVMRNDLDSLNPGKLAAQAAHVANAFVGSLPKKKTLKLYDAWEKQTTQHFGTTITLGADKQFIFNLVNSDQQPGILFDAVFDPTYPCFVTKEIGEILSKDIYNSYQVDFTDKGAVFYRHELVGAYVFGDKNNPDLQNLLSGLELYP